MIEHVRLPRKRSCWQLKTKVRRRQCADRSAPGESALIRRLDEGAVSFLQQLAQPFGQSLYADARRKMGAVGAIGSHEVDQSGMVHAVACCRLGISGPSDIDAVGLGDGLDLARRTGKPDET